MFALLVWITATIGCRERPQYRVGDYLSPIGNSDPNEIIKVLAVNKDSYWIAERPLQAAAASYQTRRREEIDGRYVRVDPSDFDPTKNRPKPPPSASPRPAAPSPTATATATVTPTPSPTPAHIPELARIVESIRPAVVIVTVFDSTGKLLRSGTGFFVSDDGRVLTTWRVMEGGVNAVVKSADGTIANVTGVLAGSAPLDLALIKTDSKRVRSLAIRQSSLPETGALVAVIGSVLDRKEGGPIEAVAAQRSEAGSVSLQTNAVVPQTNIGAPVVDSSGEVIGIVATVGSSAEAQATVRSASAVPAFLTGVAPSIAPRWPAVANAAGVFEAKRPTPTPTPAMRELRLLFAPAPTYPIAAQYAQPANTDATGLFRIQFAPDGRAVSVTTLRSTGVRALDAATIEALGRWRSEAGASWQKTVPVTFTRPRR